MEIKRGNRCKLHQERFLLKIREIRSLAMYMCIYVWLTFQCWTEESATHMQV